MPNVLKLCITLLLIAQSLGSSTKVSYVTRQFRSLSLFEVNLEENRILNETILVDGFTDEEEIHLAIDPYTKTLYYSFQGQIHEFSINTKESRLIPSFSTFLDERITTLALDYENGLLYIGVANDGAETSARIEVCPIKSGGKAKECAVLLHENLDPPHYLVLDFGDGFMYWINSVQNHIERAFMNGDYHDRHPFQDPVMISTSSMSPLTSLSFQPSTNSLYYVRTSQSQSEIWICLLSKRDSCILVSKKPQILHFSLIQNYFLWSSFSKDISFCEMDSCDLTTNSLRNLPKDYDSPELFIPLDQSQGNIRMNNSCKISNGGCSDYCLFVKFGSSCLCEKGVKMLDDSKTCDPNGIDKVILTATSSGLFIIPIDTNASIPIFFQNKTETMTPRVEDLDWDPIRNEIIWIDLNGSPILRKSTRNGNNTQEFGLGSDNLQPTSIRVDPLTGNVILLGKTLGTIQLINIEKRLRRNIVVGLEEPNGLIFDYERGKVFYTTIHLDERRIFSASIDGFQMKILADIERTVRSIEIDRITRKIYWIEGKKLQIMNDDGSALKSIKLPQNHGNVYSISKLNDTIYIANTLGRKMMAYKIDGDEVRSFTQLNHGIYGPSQIKALSFHSKISSHKSLCSIDNGGCSHFCFQRLRKVREKLDEMGLEMIEKNGKSCVLPKSSLIVVTHSSLFTITSNGLFHELPIKKSSGSIAALTIDNRNKMIIMASSNKTYGEISAISIDGTETRTIFGHSLLSDISSITIHPRTRNIYWTTKTSLKMVDWSGRYTKTLLWNQAQTIEIRFDDRFGNLYLLEEDKDDSNRFLIRMLSSDGKASTIVENFTSRVSTLEIDQGRIYRAEQVIVDVQERKSVTQFVRSDLKGLQEEILDRIEEKLVTEILPIELDLVWIDFEESSIRFLRSKKNFTIDENLGDIRALGRIDHQEQKVQSPCDEMSCDQLCFENQGIGECECADHYQLDYDNVCRAQTSFIYVASSSGLYRTLTKDPRKSLNKPESLIPVIWENIGHPNVLAYDSSGSNIILYWSEQNHPNILNIAVDFVDNQMTQIHLQDYNCSKILSISVDQIGKQLFVLCSKYPDYHGEPNENMVQIFRIEGYQSFIQLHFIGTILGSSGKAHRKDTKYTTDLAIFPQIGHLFYVDIGDPDRPTIYSCSFDGKNCRVWLSETLRGDTRIFADPQNRRLFYTTPSGVWSRDVDTPNSKIKHHYIRLQDDSRLSVAAITEDFIFIAEDERLTITGTPYEYNDIGSINGLVYVPPLERRTSVKQCSRDKCSFICSYDRMAQGNFKCLCPMKYTTSRNSDLHCEPEVECFPWQFKCGDGRTCVHRAARCDFIRDCPDNSDEDLHLCEVVGVDRWPCENGMGSIMRTSICDGKQDCMDNSDESACRCPSNHVDCQAWPGSLDDTCISRTRLCDGIDDCSSRVDENSLMCSNLSPSTLTKTTPEWLYLALLGCLCLPLTVLFCWCCIRQKPLITTVVEQPIYHYNTGATTSILLPPESRGRHVELALRTYSVVDSSSSGQPLPSPPKRYHGSNISSNNGRQGGQPALFYAPPPSAASLSTYGVVKPTSMKLVLDPNSSSTRRRWKSREHSREPPPSYYESGSNLIQTSEPILVDFPSPSHSQQLREEQLLSSRRITPYRTQDSYNSGSQRSKSKQKRPLLVPSNSRLESSEGEADKSSQDSES